MRATTRIDRAALNDVSSPFAAFKPPKRMSVSQGANENLFLRQPGGYVGPWSPDETPYMVEPMDMLASKRHEAVCFVGPARTGKALDVDTPIPTPTGWSTMGALKVGDEILSPSGKPTKVVFVTEYQHNRPCYLVEFSDGESVVADADHRWGVERFYRHGERWRYEVKTTSEMLADLVTNQGCSRYRIRNTAPIDLPDADLPIDPYVLGLWLGDGDKTRSTICSHEGDTEELLGYITAAGYRCEAVKHSGKSHRLWIDKGTRGIKGLDGTFVPTLKTVGLYDNKHIPVAYLRASAKQRLALLQGLMDTDGHTSGKTCQVSFTNVDKRLLDGVLELCRSLGFTTYEGWGTNTQVHKGVTTRHTYCRIKFSPPKGVDVFRLKRKKNAVLAPRMRDISCRAVRSITSVESRPVKCIQVADESHLFLAGRAMIPTHNTLALLDAWITYAATCDPGDFLCVHMTQEKAREYSKTRIDRAIRHSPNLNALMPKTGHNDNTHDKLFRHGMWLKIGWPTVTQLSGSDYRYVALTDYDRMADDIDGEGAPYGLALKRTQTFLSRGMCMIESSPGRPITDPNWRQTSAHEGPPCTGVVGIYNNSDRRRWYWPCPECSEYFEAKPGLDLFGLPDEKTLIEIVREADIDDLARKYAKVICPHCGCLLDTSHKHPMNQKGRWLADGETITPDGVKHGAPIKATIAGYWLGGVAAAYQSWHSLISRYLQGLREYVLTGSELTLQNTTNTDQGLPYLSRLLANAMRSGSGPESRRDSELERFIVPDETRFVAAAIDVQGGQSARFVVQVHAVGPYQEQWPIDRYAITESKRIGVDGGFAPIDPASYPEDWDTITELVVKATYRTREENREIKVKAVAVDTGGEDGVTDKSYEWYRRLRAEGLHGQVMLVKGASTPMAPLVKESWVGSKRQGTDKGDVPLYLLNTNLFKDAVAAALKRPIPGPTYMHMPSWLPKAFFDELHAEIRDEKGRWMKVRKRNEAFDLMVYIRALCVRLGADRPEFWESPPSWARPLHENSLVITREERKRMQSGEASTETPGQLRRRSGRSSYIR